MNPQSNVLSVLKNEVDNQNDVHLYLEGNVWCAYERSAFYLVSLHTPVKVKKEIVEGGYDVVLLKAMYPVDAMRLPLAPNTILRLVSDDELIFQINIKIDGFPEWKESQLKTLSA